MLAEKQVSGSELGRAVGRLYRAAELVVRADKLRQASNGPITQAQFNATVTDLAAAVRDAGVVLGAEVGGEEWR